jgi:hypothetical protein
MIFHPSYPGKLIIMNEQHKITRRTVIGGLGAGIAAMAVSPSFAAHKKTSEKSFIPQKLEDLQQNIQSHPLMHNHNPGQVLPEKWIQYL